MKKLETDTKKNNGFFLNIALNYGGRNEIIRSTKKIAKDLLSDKISVDDINETLFSSYLDTSGQKDPDLIIRTAGEMRLSNFLLWQSVYSELYFSNKMWPEFTAQDFEMAVHSFRQRNRKFGYKEYDFKKIV